MYRSEKEDGICHEKIFQKHLKNSVFLCVSQPDQKPSRNLFVNQSVAIAKKKCHKTSLIQTLITSKRKIVEDF
jgi:hypothetical protein